jgi:hypothetical protein
VNLAMAGVMHEPQIREDIFAPASLGLHMMHVEFFAVFQVLVADRANALLPLDELSVPKRRHLRFGSSLVPVILQGRVIGRIRRWH